MKLFEKHLVEIKNKWFIETRTGYDGPFESKDEAKEYLLLLKDCDAARSEFAGLEFSPF
ncbi:hypothetical protein MNBD_GAMMA23-825 [hydrothermal vent metagenome]|uniref:Uncharacterized protein n=1 Tax=hydrothermal vent metagenome TaxID=652676 RepID=A0A3B0ZYM9_9ZZZZ